MDERNIRELDNDYPFRLGIAVYCGWFGRSYVDWDIVLVFAAFFVMASDSHSIGCATDFVYFSITANRNQYVSTILHSRCLLESRLFHKVLYPPCSGYLAHRHRRSVLYQHRPLGKSETAS